MLLRVQDFEELRNNLIMLNVTAQSSNWLGQSYFIFHHSLKKRDTSSACKNLELCTHSSSFPRFASMLVHRFLLRSSNCSWQNVFCGIVSQQSNLCVAVATSMDNKIYARWDSNKHILYGCDPLSVSQNNRLFSPGEMLII